MGGRGPSSRRIPTRTLPRPVVRSTAGDTTDTAPVQRAPGSAAVVISAGAPAASLTRSEAVASAASSRRLGSATSTTGVAGVPSTSSPDRRKIRTTTPGQGAAHGGAVHLTANPRRGCPGFPLAGGGRVGAGGGVLDLLTGGDAVLEDALGAGAGRVGVAALGLGLRHRRRRFVRLVDEPGVVDARHRLPGGDAIAFAHQDLRDSPRDLRRHLGVPVGERRHGPAQLDRVLDRGRLDGRAADRALAGRSFRLLAPAAAAARRPPAAPPRRSARAQRPFAPRRSSRVPAARSTSASARSQVACASIWASRLSSRARCASMSRSRSTRPSR